MTPYLAVSIELSDGRVLRIGPDESQVGDIPTSFSFETQMPGGFGPASLVIPRPPNLYADDARLFSSVVVYGEGMRVIYEGYVTGLPQQGEEEIQIQLSGWSTILERIQNFRQIFVDRDLNNWKQAPATRQLSLLQNNQVAVLNAPSIQSSATLPSLTLTNSPSVSDNAEAWFDAGPGLLIKQIFIQKTTGPFAQFTSNQLRVGFSNSEAPPSPYFEQVTGFGANLSNERIVANPPTRYAQINWQTNGELQVSGIAVYGNHTLGLVAPEPRGVRQSEAIAYIVGNSGLNLLPESIEETDLIVPHLSFLQDTSPRAIIENLNVLGGKGRLPNDWGTYENREFFWRTPGTYGKVWRVRSENISDTRSDGPDSILRTAGVKVNYQDATGETRSVGPPNSFSDFETSQLLSIDQDNPALSLPGFHTQSIGITTRAGAVNVGRVLLNERNRLTWRGSLQMQGQVMDSEGKIYPVHRVRAGDHIIVEDDDDTRPRPINSTSYNHDNLSLNASLGAVPDTLDSLLARLAAVTDLFV